MHQSISSANIPPRQTPGKFFKVVKSPALGQNFSTKARPPGQNTPTPGECFRKSSQPFLLIGVEILEFYRNQTFKKLEGCPVILWSYPLVSVKLPYLKCICIEIFGKFFIG